jgi:hypothetical protein
MTTPDQPGWYDDPNDPSAQRYWDGQDWTPHRQRKPAPRPAQPSSAATPPQPSPPPNLLPPPSNPSNFPPAPSSKPNLPPPPPTAQPAQSPPPGQPVAPLLERWGTTIGLIVVAVLLAAAAVLAYKYYVADRSTSSSSAPTEAPYAGAPAAGGIQCKITVNGQDITSPGCSNTYRQRIPGGPPGTDIGYFQT